MNTDRSLNPTVLKDRKFSRWTIFGASVISLVAGMVLAQLFPSNRARAKNDQVYELLVYHAVPGKVPALQSRFRTASKLQKKHGIDAIGYWIPEGSAEWQDTFLYVVAHPSLDEARKNWDAFHADPAFQEYVKSEQAERLIEKVERSYMRPADFSPIR